MDSSSPTMSSTSSTKPPDPLEEMVRDIGATIEDEHIVDRIFRGLSVAAAPAQSSHIDTTPILPPSPHPYWTEGPKANWLLLPRQVLAIILLKLGAFEIIVSAQKVCTQWRSACFDPSMWIHNEIRKLVGSQYARYNLEELCFHAIDRSRGGCIDISVENIGDDRLLNYIIKSGCQLSRLRLVCCSEVSNEGFAGAVTKLSRLETFENYYGHLSEEALVALGQNCPRLTTLKFITGRSSRPCRYADEEALVIAKYMPGLQRLTLIGHKLTNLGLEAILDGCPLLESLDLRQSYNVDLRGDIVKRCRLVNNLRHPLDPFDGYGSDDLVKDDYLSSSDDSIGSYDPSDYSHQRPPPPLPRYWTRGPKPNWLELPRVVLMEILLKLGTIEIIGSAQKVCTLWRDVCMDPSMWTCIEMRNLSEIYDMVYDLAKMCRHAIDLSHGGCVDINMESCGDDELLNYVVESGCKLRRIRLAYCESVTNEGLSEATQRMPFLETFECYMGNLDKEALRAIGKNCPRLTTLRYYGDDRGKDSCESDEEAFVIAKHMPVLRHLSLFANTLTNKGLGAILDGCRHLDSVDLRHCFNVDVESIDVAKKCERIRDLKHPLDFLSDEFFPFSCY